jgi:diguanylate cyclase (GGDEF)-like protein/PAS domain S-box-containing protein
VDPEGGWVEPADSGIHEAGGWTVDERIAPLYRALFEHLPVVVYVDEANELSSAVYMSSQIEGLLGYTVDEWQSDPELFVKCLHPDDRDRVLQKIKETTERREPYSDEYRLIARDGRVVWFHDESVHVPGSNMTPGYLVDITDRKEAEEEQRRRNEELAALRDALRQELSERTHAEEALQDTVVRLRQSQLELTIAHEEVIRRLSYAAEFRDVETGRHVERMGHYCALLAARLGLDEQRCELIRTAAGLHDIGKIGVPDSILLKPGSLTAEERSVVERHAEIGHAILSGPGSFLLELAATIAWTHHERFDGTGYPRRLTGEEIPLEGRIAAVADVFDALTSDRPYRDAFEDEEALSMMTGGRGTQFDPLVLDLFVEIVGKLNRAAEPCPAGDTTVLESLPHEASPSSRPRIANLPLQVAPALGPDLGTLARLFADASALRGVEAVAEFTARTLGKLLELESVQVSLAGGSTPYALASFWRRPESSLQPLLAADVGRIAAGPASLGGALTVLDPAEFGLEAVVAVPRRILWIPLRVGGSETGILVGVGAVESVLPEQYVEAALLVAQHAGALIEGAQAIDREQRAAATDSLTGLLNRRGFALRFREELRRAERAGRELAIVVLDCDDLKSVNDEGGHELGDAVLQRIAWLLRSSKRLQDGAARLGGDEFALLLPEVDAAEAVAAAERLRRVIEERTLTGNRVFSATFGVAVYPGDGLNEDALLRAADRAMELAKRSGKNRTLALGSASVAS